MGLSDIDYCLNYTVDNWFVYKDSLQYYQNQSYYGKRIQTGADNSNCILEI